MKKELGVNIIIILILISIIIILSKCQYDRADSLINDKVKAIHGTVISINIRSFSSPFLLTKGEQAYEFIYSINGKKKVGWYKQGLVDRWILDYQGEKDE